MGDLPRPGPLGDPEVVDRVEIRVTGQPDPMRDQHGAHLADFPPYDFTFRTDRPDQWQHAALVAARALTQWTDGRVKLRRVRVETRASEWLPVGLDDLSTPDTEASERR